MRERMKEPATLSEDARHYWRHAGWSYPAEARGRAKSKARAENAEALAKAMREGKARGWYVEWEEDGDADTSWMDAEARAEFERGETIMLQAILYGEDASVLGSLGGVHVTGWSDPYCRVCEAELMSEALDTEARALRAMAL